MKKDNINILDLVNNNGCFDLQFRKDIRRERLNSPTYYRWKIQFIIALPSQKLKSLKKIKETLGCGNLYLTNKQALFSVQKIDDIISYIVPFFRKNKLSGNKRNDFELWQRAVDIIYSNKGKYIADWKKNDLLSLIQIRQSTKKYKNGSRNLKWLPVLKSMVKNL